MCVFCCVVADSASCSASVGVDRLLQLALEGINESIARAATCAFSVLPSRASSCSSASVLGVMPVEGETDGIGEGALDGGSQRPEIFCIQLGHGLIVVASTSSDSSVAVEGVTEGATDFKFSLPILLAFAELALRVTDGVWRSIHRLQGKEYT